MCERTARQSFLDIIGGKRRRLNGVHHTSRSDIPSPQAEPPSNLSMFGVAPHVLPSSVGLCPRVMKHLLPLHTHRWVLKRRREGYKYLFSCREEEEKELEASGES